MTKTTTSIRALAAIPVLALGACVSEAPRPVPVSVPVQTAKVIRAEGGGNYVLPDGTRVSRDDTGGFQLPNGAYVQRTTSGDLLLPNGNVCRPSGRDFICP